jgi:hypothetical protein
MRKDIRMLRARFAARKTQRLANERKKNQLAAAKRPKENTVLVAGPWQGEFGWELFRWQAHIRAMSRDYERTVVVGRPGHKYLYADFVHTYIEVDSSTVDCCGPQTFDKSPVDFRNLLSKYGVTSWTHWQRPRGLRNKPEYLKYGVHKPACEYDIVMHARAVYTTPAFDKSRYRETKETRNWPKEKWVELAAKLKEEGLSMCCIGTKDAAYLVPGAADKRGCSMERLANILHSSKLCIGPSSGPIHYASLCGCPHMVWTAAKNVQKYRKTWNPFSTPTHMIVDETWNPSVYDVLRAIHEMQ